MLYKKNWLHGLNASVHRHKCPQMEHPNKCRLKKKGRARLTPVNNLKTESWTGLLPDVRYRRDHTKTLRLRPEWKSNSVGRNWTRPSGNSKNRVAPAQPDYFSICVNTFPEAGTVDLPLECCCPGVSLRLLYCNDVSTSTVSQGACLACFSCVCGV